jgi:acyl-CoA dehydrogenase
MEYEDTPEQSMLRETAVQLAEEFDRGYWRQKEEAGEFGGEFWDALAEAGFHGLLVPEEYDGAEMGAEEMSIAMETLCANGCGMAGTWYLVLTAGMAAFGIREFGSESQRKRYLPDIASGSRMFCIGITEPEAGTNTPNIETRAERDGDEYVLNGNKAWITFSDRADNMLLVARTTPRSAVETPTDGISLFVIDMADPAIEVSPIPKHGINYSNSCEVFIDDLRVPVSAILGEEGDGWWHLVETLNLERIAFAAAAAGIGGLAIDHAVEYANDREVFGAPIGTHQAVSFPVTKAHARLENARLMRRRAAGLFDDGAECAYESNLAKATSVEAGIDAVYHAMQAFGGWGYATENDIERWWREINLTRLAPITQQMAYNFIAEELGFPRAY